MMRNYADTKARSKKCLSAHRGTFGGAQVWLWAL